MIERVRTDLRSRLSAYKMPRLLRIVQDYPRTATGKVVKKKVRDTLFPPKGHPEVQLYKPKASKL
jgi:malonyl-CoA/methylmalonyl-CoA synthetase